MDLEGTEDSDKVYGEAGNDTIDLAVFDQPVEYPSPPVDQGFGDAGNDTIVANDGNKDTIDCGRGKKDTVTFDMGIDTVKNCEVKHPM